MIIGTPISWFIAEIISVILFFICLVHASRQEHAASKILELFGLVLAAGIFENAGVLAQVYDYNLARIMLFGKVPISILFLEAAIFYSTFLLVEHLKVPKWLTPFLVGFFCMVQDMTLDLSAVGDLHNISNIMSGRWNWTIHYSNNFFGIPFFNFSGWFYMMAYYTAFILIGRWLFNRKNKAAVGIAYPVVAGLLTPVLIGLPITRFLLWGSFATNHGMTNELIMLLIHCSIAIIIMLRFKKLNKPIDLKKDWIIFGIPTFLHLYDLLAIIIIGINGVLLPVIVVTILHLIYLCYIYSKSKKMQSSVLE